MSAPSRYGRRHDAIAGHLNYGDMLLRRNGPGGRGRAVALLRQALEFARESGMGKVQRDSERLLASAGD